MASFSLTALPWKIQLAIFVVLSLAAGGAFFYFYDMPKTEALGTRQTELAGMRSRIDRGLATARQLPEFRKQVAELELKLDALRPILPDEKDAAELLRRIETLARESRLTLVGFKPQQPTQKQMHAEWPIALQIEGTYHNLGMFLDRVSKFPRIINVSQLVITTKQNPQPDATIEVACTATTFVLIDAPAAPAEGKGKKGAPPKAAPKKSE
jgi:type IV pilus assembly protein PilO